MHCCLNTQILSSNLGEKTMQYMKALNNSATSISKRINSLCKHLKRHGRSQLFTVGLKAELFNETVKL